jgi:site-specific DNA-methyltransferase (adenine-specific)
MIEVRHGDCRELMKNMSSLSVDALLTDPPYEYGFMGKRWDGTGVAFDRDVWEEAYRVMKPGAHGIAFGADRRVHRLMCAIEDAGFELRTMGFWVSASSFPKSMNISKAVDSRLGKLAEREDFVGRATDGHVRRDGGVQGGEGGFHRPWMEGDEREDYHLQTAAATPEAARWEGWGTALKNQEPWVLFRKPLEGTVADNILKHGVGGLYIDGCRLPGPPSEGGSVSGATALGQGSGWNQHQNRPTEIDRSMVAGRWPSSIVCSDEDMEGPIQGVAVIVDQDAGDLGGVLGPYTKHFRIGSQEDQAIITALPDELLMRILPTGVVHPKANTGEREMGLTNFDQKWVDPTRKEGSAGRANPRAGAGRSGKRKNVHPTVKPIGLMRHLLRLITPKDGIVLDPFCGSGSTGVAAVWEGARFIGLELTETKEQPFVTISKARIRYAQSVHRTPEITHRMAKSKAVPEEQQGFGF